MPPHDLYLAHRDVIERALASVCRRQHLSGPDAEDFCSSFRLRLLEDDCAVIRRFRDRCSIQHYLVAVISHSLQDWRNARWGKWRSSAEAKRLGPIAVQLEILLVRDRLPFDVAHEWLRTHHRITASRAELEALAVRFPDRNRPSFVSDQDVGSLEAPDPPADVALIEREASEMASRAMRLLRAALGALPHQDHLIVRMIVEDGLSIADVARALRLDQKPLYRRIKRLLAGLRTRLERDGLSAEAVAELLACRGLDASIADEREKGGRVRLFSRERSPIKHGEGP